MATFKLQYVNSFTDARGKRRHVFRREGHKKATIKGVPGTPEFMEAYHALLEKTGGSPSTIDIGASRTKAGSIDALMVAYYKHDAFTKGLAKATQSAWRNILDRFREFKTPSGRRYGENRMATIQQKSVVAFLEGKTDGGKSRTSNAQKNSLKAIRGFIRFAMSQGELTYDPTESIKVAKGGPKSMGHMTWLEPQIAQYRECHQLGSMARLALELLLNIAARRHDAHLLGQQHVRDAKLSWRPHKTQRSTGKMLTIKIIPELQAALDAIPKTGRADGVLTFLVNDYGRAFASAAAFGNKFADWCKAAGLKPVLCDDGRTRNYRAHGLRKAALRALAHAGATGVELMAVSGHSSLEQLQEYLNEVEQERMAEAAMSKLASVPRGQNSNIQ
jgi:integrase/recombinase XerD